ncbi:Tetratricopeptide repeat protein [Ectocarpus siliculosus]|uniref:Tetratricopeptide repeat protein n=1 Tax=Ectocarpus siliculosus TaxID=2880 RepID=D7G3B0_ECTSI|nr:Tetratricopeptide repeat protein [Ectocarpus siliculosus]|eukprot:CBJ33504.1 Tetratricopeptide repeat protein [Ectocarpus siliculosus]
MSGHNQAWSTRKKAPALEKKRGEFAEAEPLYDRSQAIRENVLGPEHADVATTLSGRAGLLERQGNYAKAESLYERSQAIRERVLGPEHPDVATMLNNLARLLLSQVTMPLEEDNSSAILDLIRAEIRLCRAVCPLHIMFLRLETKRWALTTTILARANNRTGLLKNQVRAQATIPKLTLVGSTLSSEILFSFLVHCRTLSHFTDAQGKYAEAEQLYERSEAIRDKTLDPDHPDVARSLNDRALLLDKKEQYTDAVPLLERALSIRMKKLGENHPDTVSTQNSLDIVRRKV